jgi:hypothetical protein
MELSSLMKLGGFELCLDGDGAILARGRAKARSAYFSFPSAKASILRAEVIVFIGVSGFLALNLPADC